MFKSRLPSRLYFLALATLCLFACSQKSVYETLQHNKQQDCAKLLEQEQERCMENSNASYEEYSREREEAIRQ